MIRGLLQRLNVAPTKVTRNGPCGDCFMLNAWDFHCTAVGGDVYGTFNYCP